MVVGIILSPSTALAWGSKKAGQRLEADLTARIAAAKDYEADCANAIGASGIAAAKDVARDRAREIHSLPSKIRKHPPRTTAGLLILARAVALFEEVQRGSYDGGEQGRGLLLAANWPTQCSTSARAWRNFSWAAASAAAP